MNQRKKITIFEGADGSGKSTAAKQFAEATGARYVHSSNWPHVTTGLPRLYLEQMLPALLGYQDVVMDRCWLSEQPYGEVYRNGSDRVGGVYRRMLERIALSCGAVVIRCDPGPETCVTNWSAKRSSENKAWENAAGVGKVVHAYRALRTELLVMDYDYTAQPKLWEPELIDSFRLPVHDVTAPSAGALGAGVVLVGQDFADVKNDDCFHQYPFVSFTKVGCSHYITEQLAQAQLHERDLLWVNANMLDENELIVSSTTHVVALGNVAAAALTNRGIAHKEVVHPAYAQRFMSDWPYELVTLLKELV